MDNATARLETFSDGVFAIAATLLILDVHSAGGSVAHGLVHAWPSYVVYAISFLTIGIIWVNHHAVMSQIGRVDRTFLFINVVFLMVVAFSPFPTRVLGAHLREGSRAAALAYGLTFTLMAVCYGALWFYAALGRRLIAPEASARVVSGITRSFLPGSFVYGAATLSSLASAYLAVALYAAIALFYVLESSLFGRDQARAERPAFRTRRGGSE
ncbi:MAG TPA: TMEM175 family protein [Gaiellaceae bacterium]|nr:TMEM175 family protein [Gaiellaceae bacterium]